MRRWLVWVNVGLFAVFFSGGAALGEDDVTSLRRLAQDHAKPAKERVRAIVLLAHTTAQEVAAEIEGLLDDSDPFCREAAALGLGQRGARTSLGRLKQALHDPNSNVRMRAAWALGRMGNHEGKSAALEAIGGTDVTAQFLAVEALEAIGDKQVIPVLRGHMQSSNVWSRIYANLAIRRLEVRDLTEEARIQYLQTALADPQYEVTRWAAEELGREGTPNAVTILKQVSRDPSSSGSYAAGKVLRILVHDGKLSSEDLLK